MGEILERRSAARAGALFLWAALSLFLAACGGQPKTTAMDDFESGALTDWKAVSSGAGGWFVYTDGKKAPDVMNADGSGQRKLTQLGS